MKILPVLAGLPALLPLSALAHPGHEAGVIATDGLPSGLLLLAAAGIAYAALRLLRRRTAARADD